MPYREINIKTVEAVNSGQTPADTLECYVFVLTKEAICCFADQFSNYFAIFDGLHVEQCLSVVHGRLIENSGLKEILETYALATIVFGAVADVNHIKRSQYCAQVTLCALYQTLVEAVKNEGSLVESYEWLSEKVKCSTMCYYWKLVLDL